ncbi:2-hydroxyacid dehydrogenase [Pseudoroseomonas globiformis]|uniref:2-hydroxyacid dehydrogenase n=1 Tax=Teichococcus globiformis TaxID=2307229 RepID=A0ABV7FXK3_9PROT
MKPLVLSAMPLTETLRNRLEGPCDLLILPPGTTAATLPSRARDARVLITLGGLHTDAAMLAELPGLGLVHCYGTGFDGVDQAAARDAGIVVTHAGDANATAVAEFALGLVLASSRMILQGDRLIREGRWLDLKLDRVPMAPGLAGRRLGIFGMGVIGMKIASRATAFEMEVGYHNRRRRDGLPYAYHESLAELAAWSDVLVVAVRASGETRHAVDASVLAALGARGVLVNISRGSVVDEAALCDALQSGAVAAAALDVFEQEPHSPGRLTAAPNTVLTPHMAALTSAAQGAQQQLVLENVTAFLAGRPVRCRIPGF